MMHVAAYDVGRANAPHRANLIAAMTHALDTGELILGPSLGTFEQQFATLCGTTHCLGVGNGLDALTIALRAIGIGPGDEVVVPAFTFIATWLSVMHAGATPVPVDVRADGAIDPALIEPAITRRTRAIVPVHLYGALADMNPIIELATRHGLDVIEDAAQAHGASLGKRMAGSFGRAAAFSFYPTKNLGALGDGGAVCTSDPALVQRVHQLRNYGSTTRYRHDLLGWNSRLDPIQAACLSAKLPHLPAAIARRRQIADRYLDAFEPASLPGIELPARNRASAWHQFVLRARDRASLQAELDRRGVGTLVHYPVVPAEQPCFAGWHDPTRHPVARHLARTVLSLPMADYLTEHEVDHVITATIEAAGSLGTP